MAPNYSLVISWEDVLSFIRTSPRTVCWCRGTGAWLEMAGFKHVGLVEIDTDASATLRRNRPWWNAIESDVRARSQASGIIDVNVLLQPTSLAHHSRLLASSSAIWTTETCSLGVASGIGDSSAGSNRRECPGRPGQRVHPLPCGGRCGASAARIRLRRGRRCNAKDLGVLQLDPSAPMVALRPREILAAPC